MIINIKNTLHIEIATIKLNVVQSKTTTIIKSYNSKIIVGNYGDF